MNKKITKMSKRMRAAYEHLEKNNVLGQAVSLDRALEVIKGLPNPKFNGSIDVAVKLSIDPAKSDQNVRGAAAMPSGMGKTMKIAVFAQSEYQKQAKTAGADYIIGDEINAKDFIAGALDVDACVATPDLMAMLMKWGVSKVLGPKGLMPNAKVGTVTFDVKNIVESLKKGQAIFKNDKAGYLHASVGRADFTADAIKENIFAFVSAVVQAKPASVKAGLIQSVTINTTMCPAIKIAMNEFSKVVVE